MKISYYDSTGIYFSFDLSLFLIHSWLSSYYAENLFLGSFISALWIKSFAYEDISLKYGLLKLRSELTIKCLTSCLFLPGNGFLPVKSIQVMTPILHMSTFSSYPFYWINSGAIYRGLPSTKSKPSFGSKTQLKPKSAIFTSKLFLSFDSSKIFSGFRSLCVMLFVCMWLIA